MTADPRLVRARAFERDVLRRTSTAVERFDFGTWYVNQDLSRRYSSGLLWVDLDVRPPAVEALAGEADRILGAAGLEHRKIVVDGDAGRVLAPGFLELGWSVDRLVLMALEHDADRRTDVSVVERDFAAVRTIVETVIRRGGYTRDEEDVRQLVEHKRLLERCVGARFFVGLIEETDAGICELYEGEGIAQIEDVNTLEEFRGRGVARATVLAAVDAARAAGAELVFLVADEQDWPRHLYERLGFEPVGSVWEFLRLPRG